MEQKDQNKSPLEALAESSQNKPVETRNDTKSKNVSTEGVKPVETQITKEKGDNKAISENVAEVSKEEFEELTDESKAYPKEEEQVPKFVKQDAVLDLLMSAKSKLVRKSATTISVSCREMVAMLNGLISDVEAMQ